MNTTALLRPCMWGLAFVGLMMTTSPAAAELPLAVFYDMTDVVAMASPQTDRANDEIRVEMPAQPAERVADSEIQLP